MEAQKVFVYRSTINLHSHTTLQVLLPIVASIISAYIREFNADIEVYR